MCCFIASIWGPGGRFFSGKHSRVERTEALVNDIMSSEFGFWFKNFMTLVQLINLTDVQALYLSAGSNKTYEIMV